jgi:hypothetical protein
LLRNQDGYAKNRNNFRTESVMDGNVMSMKKKEIQLHFLPTEGARE